MIFNNGCCCGKCGCDPCKCASCSTGPRGPVGPQGPKGATGSGGMSTSTFNPGNTSSYTAGQILTSGDGLIYVVNKNSPSGAPGASSDYTPIAGPAGRTTTQTYNPAQASGYTAGQLLVSNGVVYVVNTNSPTGTPGQSGSGYTALTGTDRTARDLGGSIVPTYSPALNSSLVPGELINRDGTLYIVNKASPSGAPGTSSDFTAVRGQPGPTGPAGATGATGPAGIQGQQGVAGTIGTVKGTETSLTTLQTNHPTGAAGDMYVVGNTTYVWDTTKNSWQPIGPVTGPQGVTGTQGNPGPVGQYKKSPPKDAGRGFAREELLPTVSQKAGYIPLD